MRRATSLIALALIISPLWLKSQIVNDFTVTDVSGDSHSLYADYLDQNKIVVVFILHSLCPDCNAIAADYQKLYSDWGSGNYDVQFIGLTNKEFDTDIKLQQFNAKYRIKLPMVSFNGGSIDVVNELVNASFSIPPLFLIIKPDRNMIYDIKGDSHAATLSSIDESLVAAGAIKPFVIVGEVKSDETPIQSVIVSTSGVADSLSNIEISFTDEEGIYEYSFSRKPDSDDVAFIPQKNHDFDNGLSTLDIVIILRHLLRTDLFDEPEDYFRADINRSGSISVSDIVALRKLLLQVDTVFENNTSWRFIPTDYKFLDPADPLAEDVPEWITIGDIENRFYAPDFKGIKVGDLNGSANPKLLDSRIRDNTKSKLLYQVSESKDQLIYSFYTDNIHHILGLQMGIEYDINSISEPVINDHELSFQDQSFGAFNTQNGGHLYLSWNDITGRSIDVTKPLFSITFKKKQHQNYQLKLSSKGLKPEIYDYLDAAYQLELEKLQDDFAVVYPNPTKEGVKIIFRKPYNGSIQLLTTAGQIIDEVSGTNTKSEELSLKNLQAGMYVVRFQKEKEQPMNYRIIKL